MNSASLHCKGVTDEGQYRLLPSQAMLHVICTPPPHRHLQLDHGFVFFFKVFLLMLFFSSQSGGDSSNLFRGVQFLLLSNILKFSKFRRVRTGSDRLPPPLPSQDFLARFADHRRAVLGLTLPHIAPPLLSYLT